MKKAIFLVLFLAVGLGLIFWRFSSRIIPQERPENKNIELNFWGIGEEGMLFRPVFEAYQRAHPNIHINFTKQSPTNYRTRAEAQIKSAKGPDIFVIHSSWLPMFWSLLSPAAPETVSLSDLTRDFYPLAKNSLVKDGKIYSLPWEVDGLVLFYNDDLLQAANLTPPTTWQEFTEQAIKLTSRDESGKIQTSGAALGTTNNIDFWPEILGLLFLQQLDGDVELLSIPKGLEIFQFYTNFVIDPRNKTWDASLPSSTRMFTQGKLAFYFAPISSLAELKAKAPKLNFKAGPVPQLSGVKQVSWGGFWTEVVSAKSAYPTEAWDLLKFLSSKEAAELIKQQTDSILGMSYLSSRVDMSSSYKNDPFLGAAASQGPFYQGWFLNSAASDGGINEEMIGIFKKLVEATLQGATSATSDTQSEVKQVLSKYEISNK